MERRFPTGWPLFIVTALAVAGVALAGARPARAQDDADLDPPPPPSDDAARYASPREIEPPPQPPDQQTFDQDLSAYGHWVDTPEYGRVWIPDGTRPDWQPYTDGQWVDTTYGWAFVSAVPWGWATFHYGRWGYGLTLGWFWVPGFIWGPAWVGWRAYPGYACWSPMPPHGFVFHGHWPGWVVMNQQHFTRPIARFAVPRSQATSIARAASPVRGFASARAGAWTGGRGGGGSRVGTPGGGHGSSGSPAGGRGGGGAHSGGRTGSNIRPGTARTGNSRTWAARPGGGSRSWAAPPGGGGSRSWSARPGFAFRGNGGIRSGGSFGGGFRGGFHMGGGGFRGGRR
jgi:hypothetical protein